MSAHHPFGRTASADRTGRTASADRIGRSPQRLVRSASARETGSPGVLSSGSSSGVERKETREPAGNDRYTRSIIRHASPEHRSIRQAPSLYAPVA
ncbi:hypothetical protein PG988_011214 [Apiospora saccharicola]